MKNYLSLPHKIYLAIGKRLISVNAFAIMKANKGVPNIWGRLYFIFRRMVLCMQETTALY